MSGALRRGGCVLLVGATLLGAAAPAGAAASTTWKVQADKSGTLKAVSCAAGTANCVAVGEGADGGPIVYRRASAASAWVSESIPSADSAAALTGVSCIASFCAAVGSQEVDFTESGVVVTSDNGGATWTDWSPPGTDAVQTLSGVSCASAGHCVVVGALSDGHGVSLDTTDGGVGWVLTGDAFDMQLLLAVSCGSTTDCVAVGQDASDFGLAVSTSNAGTSWSTQLLPGLVDPPVKVVGVSCPSATVCAAVATGDTLEDEPPAVLLSTTHATTAGTIWTETAMPTSGRAIGEPGGVSCPTTADCTAVGSAAGGPAISATTGSLTSWANETTPSGPTGLLGVSCPSTNACAAVGATSTGSAIIAGSTPATRLSTKLAASVSPATTHHGHKVTYRAKVRATGATPSGGTIVFTIGSRRMCTASLHAGKASCTSTKAPVGKDKVKAHYGGAAGFAASSGTTKLKITRA